MTPRSTPSTNRPRPQFLHFVSSSLRLFVSSSPRHLCALCVLFSWTPVQAQPLTLQTTTRTYPAHLHIPTNHNRVGVLLIGGGSVTDMHWTVPGRIEIPQQDGTVEIHEPTIGGETTRDADALAAALTEAGFIVMQYSSIHVDDELARRKDGRSTGMATGVPYTDSVPIARRALEVLREREEIDRIILLGHSLGAARACHITHLPQPPEPPTQPADPAKPVIAIVALAGAYMTPIKDRPSVLSARALEGADVDGDRALSRQESLTAGVGGEDAANFERMDRDHDGVLRGWEVASWTILEAMNAGERSWDDQRPGSFAQLPWPAEVLAAHPQLPVLAVFGGLDAITVHAPLLERWSEERELERVTIEIRPTLGHQLSVEEDGKFGAIDGAVVERVVEWCSEVAGDQ